jgi:hypothetical protein
MLTMHDKSHTTTLAAVARLVVAYHNGMIKNAHSRHLGEVTNSEILRVVESDPHVVWAVGEARARTIPAKPTAVGFAAWMIGREDAESASSFLANVAEMRTDGVGDPRYTLLRRLNTANEQREDLHAVAQAWLIVRAWQAWRNGETLKQLKMVTSSGVKEFPLLTGGSLDTFDLTTFDLETMQAE